MNWVIVTIIVFVIGIIVLSGKSLLRKKSREEYLNELAHFLETRVETLEDYENSYKINFDYKGKKIELQDVEYKTFDRTTYKVYLRTKSLGQLTINFTEQPRDGIKKEVIQSSQIGKGTAKKVVMPKSLKKFQVYTNSFKVTTRLFDNDEVLGIFSRYQYEDARGHPVMPIRVQDGNVVFEFDSDVTLALNFSDLKDNVSKIDIYLDKLVALTDAINQLENKGS